MICPNHNFDTIATHPSNRYAIHLFGDTIVDGKVHGCNKQGKWRWRTRIFSSMLTVIFAFKQGLAPSDP
jgi:hypothetical protein